MLVSLYIILGAYYTDDIKPDIIYDIKHLNILVSTDTKVAYLLYIHSLFG